MLSREASMSMAVRETGFEPGCIGPVIDKFYEAVKYQTKNYLKAPQIVQPFLFHDLALFNRIKVQFLQAWGVYDGDFRDTHQLIKENVNDVSSERENEFRCVLAAVEFLGSILLQPSRLKVVQECPTNSQLSKLQFSFLCSTCRSMIESIHFNHEKFEIQFRFVNDFSF